MSDILKRVSFLDDDAPDVPLRKVAAADAPPIEAVPDAPVLRRTGDPTLPKAPTEPAPASALPSRPIRPQLQVDSADARTLPVWAGALLAMLTAATIAVLLLAFVVGPSGAPLGAWQVAGLVCAVVVPALAVIALWATLRALQSSRAQTAQLSAAVERLLQPDAALGEDVATMATAVRGEIERVDARMGEARDRLEGFGAALSQQERSLDQTTKTMAERSETIGKALTLHRQAFESLATTFDARMESLSAQIEQQRGRLSDTSAAAQADLEAARRDVEDAGKALAEAVSAAAGSSRAADASLDSARARLDDMVGRVQDSAAELDAVYERRADHLASLTDRLSGERDSTQAVLRQQTERLGAVDAQLEITEGRLTALVDHARRIHEGLMGQLSAIDATLDGADNRSRRFTEALSDRVADAVADARRDLSLMESDLRALQSRLSEAADAPALDVATPQNPRPAPGRVHLKPLDTDFPPVEPPRPEPVGWPAPDVAAQTSPAASAATAEEPAPLELVEFADDDFAIPEEPDAPPAADLVQRPGQDPNPRRGRSFGKAGKEDADASGRTGWRWRDMLGGIDPLDTTPPTTPTTAPTARAPGRDVVSSVVRPPAGVALTPPPAAPQLPDGSDVVARLCEVQLAPSSVVDEAAILEASRAPSEAALVAGVVARLRDPVTHLRGVLSADLEFRLRAESFVRSMSQTLVGTPGAADRHALLGTASGRAFLLCLAALRA